MSLVNDYNNNQSHLFFPTIISIFWLCRDQIKCSVYGYDCDEKGASGV